MSASEAAARLFALERKRMRASGAMIRGEQGNIDTQSSSRASFVLVTRVPMNALLVLLLLGTVAGLGTQVLSGMPVMRQAAAGGCHGHEHMPAPQPVNHDCCAQRYSPAALQAPSFAAPDAADSPCTTWTHSARPLPSPERFQHAVIAVSPPNTAAPLRL